MITRVIKVNNWTDAIYLVTLDSTKDSDGFDEEIETKSELIPANFKSITRSEEEHSKIMGYNASLVVQIMLCNYNNQELLIDDYTNKKYAIERTYPVSSEIIELTCSDISRKNG